jgi:hypothetical protein
VDRTIPFYGSCQSRPPRVLTTGMLCQAWRTGALRGVVSLWESLSAEVVPRSWWAPLSRAPTFIRGPGLSWRRKLLVRAGSRRRRLLVRTSSQRRGEDYLSERVVGDEAETTRANRQQVGDRASCR